MSDDPLSREMCGVIRGITNDAGHGGVPFLDDAVRNVVIERNRAWSALLNVTGPRFGCSRRWPFRTRRCYDRQPDPSQDEWCASCIATVALAGAFLKCDPAPAARADDGDDDRG